MAEDLPTPGLYVTDDLVQIYQDGIDQLISDMGRNVTLHLEPSKTRCPNCYQVRVGQRLKSTGRYNSSNPNPLGPLNKPFSSGICPVCRGLGLITTKQSYTFKGLIQWHPKNIGIDVSGRDFEDVCRIKCLQENNEDKIKVAINATVDGELVELFKGPTQRGVRDIRYIDSFWVKVKNQ